MREGLLTSEEWNFLREIEMRVRALIPPDEANFFMDIVLRRAGLTAPTTPTPPVRPAPWLLADRRLVRDGWAVVSLLGHVELCGYVHIFEGGLHVIRVPACRIERDYDVVQWQPRVIEAYSHALYALAWTTEEQVMAMLQEPDATKRRLTAPPNVEPPAFDKGMELVFPSGATVSAFVPPESLKLGASPPQVRFDLQKASLVANGGVDWPDQCSSWLTEWPTCSWSQELKELKRLGVTLHREGVQIWPPVVKPVVVVGDPPGLAQPMIHGYPT